MKNIKKGREVSNIPYYLTEDQKSKKGLKLHIGCSNIYLNNWINIDLGNPTADMELDCLDLSSEFDDNSADLIISSHLIEHFDDTQVHKAMAEWYRVLNRDGWLIVECPNFQASLELFLAIPKDDIKSRVMNFPQIFGRPDWHEYQIHRTGFWPERMIALMREVGFKDINKEEPREDGIEKICMRFDARK